MSSARIPFGEYEGLTLQEIAERGDAAVLLWILGRASLCLRQPQLYREAWRRLIEYGMRGGLPPDVWIDERGLPQFRTSRNRPSTDGSLEIHREPDCAVICAISPGATIPKRTLVADAAASLPAPAPGCRDRRRERVRAAIERLRKRGALFVRQGAVTRTRVAVRAAADLPGWNSAGLDLV